jgi:hypothetical protein
MVSVRIPLAVGVLALLVAGCSTAQPAALPTSPARLVAPPNASPTPLATQPPDPASIRPAATPKATPKPTPRATPRPTPKPTAKPASYYKPPGWDGYSDVNCPDFDTHAHAQSFFQGTGGTTSNDPYGLDRDHDGIACETLP